MLKFKGKPFPEGVVVRNVENSVLPPVTTNTMEIPARHGGLDFGRVFGMREITVTVGIKGKTDEDVRSIVRELASQLNSKDLQPLVLPDETDKQYMARVSADTALTPAYRYEEASITFLCPDPLAYSINNSNTNLNANASTNVNVSGTYNTFPTFTCNVISNTGTLSITNVTTNETITLVDSFVNGDEVIVDCSIGKVTVNGSLANIVTLDSDFPELVEGSNEISTSGSAEFAVTYKNAWL